MTEKTFRTNGETVPHQAAHTLRGAVNELRGGLREGGPAVDHAAVYAYAAGALVEDERRLVAERIATWWAWFDAYREVLP